MNVLPISKCFLSKITIIPLRNVSINKNCFFLQAQIGKLNSSKRDDSKSKFLVDKNVDEDSDAPKIRKKTKEAEVKINIRDINGTVIGFKTKKEAEQIAHKNNWILVKDDLSKKIPTFKFVDPREEQVKEAELDDDKEIVNIEHESRVVNEKKHRSPPKHLLFSAKLSEHDLQTKINHIRKWVSQGQEVTVKINSPVENIEKIKAIDRDFEKAFNRPEFGVKINQKRLTSKDLKFAIIPMDLSLVKKLWDHKKQSNDQFEQKEIDPNELLSSVDDSVIDKLKKEK